MRRPWLELALGGLLLGLTGCGGGDPPAAQPLSAEEEKAFEQQQEEARKGERPPAE